MNTQPTFLTEEGLKKIQEELQDLKKNKRREIAQRIQEAKELGDLSENAEYIEAKEEQGFIEAHILDLEKTLKNSQLITRLSNTSIVQIGATIRIRNNKGDILEYTIVGSSEADPRELRISNESPLGKAFIGHHADEKVVVRTPRGDDEYEILSIR